MATTATDTQREKINKETVADNVLNTAAVAKATGQGRGDLSINHIVNEINRAGGEIKAVLKDIRELLDPPEPNPVNSADIRIVHEEYCRIMAGLEPVMRSIGEQWGSVSDESTPHRVKKSCNWIDSISREYIAAAQQLTDKIDAEPICSGSPISLAVQELVELGRQMGPEAIRRRLSSCDPSEADDRAGKGRCSTRGGAAASSGKNTLSS